VAGQCDAFLSLSRDTFFSVISEDVSAFPFQTKILALFLGEIERDVVHDIIIVFFLSLHLAF